MGVCQRGQGFQKKVGKEEGNRNGREGLGILLGQDSTDISIRGAVKSTGAGVLFRPSLPFPAVHSTGADRPIYRGNSEGRTP
jgi:hypothetical protein